jgi:predicted dehydrogenase
MKDQIGIGIVGVGIMGSKHARIYSEIPGAKIVAIADINLEKANSVAAQYGAQAVSDYKELLGMKEIDAMHIATPDHLHRNPVIDSLKAGKHVLVEKPMATSVPDAKEIVSISKQTGCHVQVNYTHRWAAPYAETERLIRSGEIGEGVMVYARKNDKIWVATEMMNWVEKTSSASYLSTHDIDLVLWFLKTDVESVYAQGVKRVLKSKGIDTEDGIQALVKFTNGGIGTFESSWILPNTMPTTTDSFIEIVGEKGTIHIDRIHEGLKVATQNQYQFPKLSMNLEIDGKLRGALRCSLENFVNALLTGSKPQPDAETGLKIVLVSSAIQESIKKSKQVTIKSLLD